MNNPNSQKKKILLLGAGLVARPLVNYLLNVPDFELTIASRTIKKADELLQPHPNGKSAKFDIESESEKLGELVSNHDLTISLLPAVHHVTVAKECIKFKKLMVTTSYVSPAMRELDAQARDAGILILNEIGLDPGIDHMSAMKIIHQVESEGGQITSFRSCCGGLPAPEANTNPFGYKFSWSPRGVVLAARNSARYLLDGNIVETPGEKLFSDFYSVKLEDYKYPLEVYPNRDSMGYIDLYGLKHAKTMFRGTFRNMGHCVTWQKFADIGYFDVSPLQNFDGKTYRDLTAFLAELPNDPNLENSLTNSLSLPHEPPVLEKWKWLGLLDPKPLPDNCSSPLDFLVAIFLEKLQYSPGERDLVILHHEFVAEHPNLAPQIITSTLVDYGIPNGDTSMARTVGLPAAVATRLILHGEINLSGVHIPVLPEIYQPVLDELETLGVKFTERTLSAV